MTLKYLINAGANLNLADKYGLIAIYCASMNGHMKIVKLMLDIGVDLTDKDGQTPLHIASYHGHAEVVKLMLDTGIDPNLIDNGGRTPIWCASYGSRNEDNGYNQYNEDNERVEVARLLLDAGADPNQPDSYGSMPIFWAPFNGYAKMVSLLLEARVDPNFYDRDGRTWLYRPSYCSCCKLTLNFKNGKAQGSYRYTDCGRRKFRHHLNANANPDLANSGGFTPI